MSGRVIPSLVGMGNDFIGETFRDIFTNISNRQTIYSCFETIFFFFFFFFKCKAEIIKASFEIPKEGIQLGRYLPHPGWSVSLESFVPQQSLCSCSVHSVLFACTGMVELGNSTE